VAVIELETRIAASPERCFDLSLSVDLHLASTARTGERVVSGPTTGILALGDEVTWEARHFGRRRRLTVRITELDRPHSFCDEAIGGALRRMRHDHRFEPDGDGTRMHDRFAFSCGVALIDRLVLARHLRRLLRERNAYLRAAAEQDSR
jgi:ligand-binding SRPBCC domain-containing protein